MLSNLLVSLLNDTYLIKTIFLFTIHHKVPYSGGLASLAHDILHISYCCWPADLSKFHLIVALKNIWMCFNDLMEKYYGLWLCADYGRHDTYWWWHDILSLCYSLCTSELLISNTSRTWQKMSFRDETVWLL